MVAFDPNFDKKAQIDLQESNTNGKTEPQIFYVQQKQYSLLGFDFKKLDLIYICKKVSCQKFRVTLLLLLGKTN